jgi:hypothetical protein
MGWITGVRFTAGARFFCPPRNSNRFWGPPSFLSNGYRRIFSPGIKLPGREADHSHPSGAEVENGGAIPPTPMSSPLESCLAYFSTLKMEAICSFKTSVDFQRTALRYIPEDGTLHNHRWEHQILFIAGKPKVKIFHERYSCRWENTRSIRMDGQEVFVWGCVLHSYG